MRILYIYNLFGAPVFWQYSLYEIYCILTPLVYMKVVSEATLKSDYAKFCSVLGMDVLGGVEK